jgi:hypothetical protein
MSDVRDIHHVEPNCPPGAGRDMPEPMKGRALLAGNAGGHHVRENGNAPTDDYPARFAPCERSTYLTSGQCPYMPRQISADGTAGSMTPLWRALLVTWLGRTSPATLLDHHVGNDR